MQRRKSGDFFVFQTLPLNVPNCRMPLRSAVHRSMRLQPTRRINVGMRGLCNKGGKRRELMRKGVMAIAAAIALGAATLTTGAMAQHGGHGGGGGMGGHGGGGGGAAFSGGGHMGGGGGGMMGGRGGGSFTGRGGSFNGNFAARGGSFSGRSGAFAGRNFAFHDGRFRGRRGFGFGFWGGPYWAYAGDCWRLRRVWTPWGWHWRRVNVCW
jgi:hypothetical protein